MRFGGHPIVRRFADCIFCGTVETVTEELKRYEAEGIEVVFLEPSQQEFIARKIIPEFK